MSKRIIGGVTLATMALLLAACSGGTTSTTGATGSPSAGAATAPSVANVINGPLGDQGFFDDAARGMALMKAKGSKIQNLQADAKTLHSGRPTWSRSPPATGTSSSPVLRR